MSKVLEKQAKAVVEHARMFDKGATWFRIYPNVKGVGINQVWNSGDRSHAAIIIKQSSGGDFALNENALKRAIAALENKKYDSMFVVGAAITSNTPVYLCHIEATAIAKLLEGVEPNPGHFGTYWWLKQHGTTLVPQSYDDGSI